MTEREKAAACLKDNIVLALLAIARNVDAIVGDDPTNLCITFTSSPYTETSIDFHRVEEV